MYIININFIKIYYFKTIITNIKMYILLLNNRMLKHSKEKHENIDMNFLNIFLFI